MTSKLTFSPLPLRTLKPWIIKRSRATHVLLYFRFAEHYVFILRQLELENFMGTVGNSVTAGLLGDRLRGET